MNDSTELDAMAQMPNDLDDLENLFEFGDIDLNNIPDPDAFDGQLQQQQQHNHSHPGTHPNTPFQDMSQPPPIPATSAHDFGGLDQFGMSQGMGQPPQQQQQFMDPHAQTSMPFTTESVYQPTMQHMYHPQSQQYQMHHQHGYPHSQQVVPPTPNSYEMHGVAGRFMERHQQLDPQQQAILAQRYALRKEEIAFTPMVSPAGTPQYHMLPEFTTPGAYFSPLTSPMLHAQNQHHHQQLQLQQQQGYITNPSTAPSSNTNSPVDPTLDIEMGSGSVHPGSTGPQPRKSGRRKIATAKGASTGGGRGSQTAAQKAQKRKSSAQLQSQRSNTGEELGLRAVQTQPIPASLQMPTQFDSSEAESISPEPLSESLMGPPPRPSTSQSPALAGQQQHANAVAAAATPKSLLTMRSAQHHINGQQGDASAGAQDLGGLDDLALPEAANTRPLKLSHAQIDTNIPAVLDGEDDTPRMSARKTPKFGPLSTPSSARPGSAMQSPVALASPMSMNTPSAILREKKDGKGGARGNKKRGSMSANGAKMMSPALVPKISPSIKPLLPEGTPLTSATQAMLLASKSNYQNLLEGNRLPGVNYPDSLSTGLTSKRTSHKVAEQGRRNRINEALKEMQALIPKSSPNSMAKSPGPNGNIDDAGSPTSPTNEEDVKGGIPSTPADLNGGTVPATPGGGVDIKALEREREMQDAAAKSNSSKAATVELANEYIKRMQREQAAQRERIARLEREREVLLGRLGEGGGTPGGSEE